MREVIKKEYKNLCKHSGADKLRFLLFTVFFYILAVFSLKAEPIIQVTDSITGETLPFSSINFKTPRKISYLTDEEGQAFVPGYLKGGNFNVSYSGYKNKNLVLDRDTIYVRLSPERILLSEVIVKPGKEKYSKRNNPAVEFMQRLRAAGKESDPTREDFYSYDKYEKTLIAINNFKGKSQEIKLPQKLKFIENYIDTSSWTGERLLDLILKEKLSTRIMSQSPSSDKEIVEAYRSTGVDEVLNQENIKILLEDVIREIDIYKPDINILQNRFVSPLSPVGPDFYKYYLSDTVYIGSEKCIELTFIPRNDKAMGFNGRLYVPIEDSTMFVRKITMRTPHNVNVNFLRNLFISQSFEKDSLGNRHKTYDDICVEMQIVAGTPEFYGRKTTVYDNFSYDKRSDLEEYYHKMGDEFRLTDSIGQTAEFWDERRMVPLTRAENRLSGFTTEMRKVPILYWLEKFIGLMESGYLTTGKPSKFDIGPLNTLISYNDVEGVRLRLGGMTMAALNPHLFLRGYAAYGTRDHKWKYNGEIEYSFASKPHHSYEWPRHGFYGSYTYDLDLLGQHYLFTNQDNVFLSLKRKESNLVTYRRQARAGYVLELPNNFSIETGIKYETQYATPWIKFEFPDGRLINKYNQGSFNVMLRWAKGEKFVQGRSIRLPVNMDAWILQLSHEYCPKGFLGSSYTVNKTEFSTQKRFWFSAFGYLDWIVKAGKIWSGVYFPALLWQNANLSYTIQPESFSLLNPMEFANDSFVSLDFTYFGNGVLFNYIPGINKLKLREAITFKGFKGWLSNRNNPANNLSLLNFPSDCQAMKMGGTPYMEIGAGIDNIFSVLRIDYVWRLTYRHNPDIDRSGIRISLHFTL